MKRSDVTFNRQHFIINSSSIDPLFGQRRFRHRPLRLRRADACALVPSEWVPTSLDDKSQTRDRHRSSHRGLRSESTTLGFLRDSDFDGHNATLSSLRGFHPVT
jgi:hypothetical protein